MINFVNFSTENHILSLFFRVRIEPRFPLKSPITYFLLNHCSDRLLLSIYFEQWRTEKGHPQIILDLRSSYQISR